MGYKTIRDVTAITGMTESALRYYDEKKILQPTVKSVTGRREWLYDDEAVRRLKQVMLYKRVGLSAAEIGELFSAEKTGREAILKEFASKLESKRTGLDRQIAAAQMLLLIEQAADGSEEERKELVEKAFELYKEDDRTEE